MPIRLWESAAELLYPYRAWYVGVTLVVIAATAVAVSAADADAIEAAFALPLALTMWPWGLLLVGTWFHRRHGTLRHGSIFVLGNHPWIAGVVREQAAWFLVLWFTVATALLLAWALG